MSSGVGEDRIPVIIGIGEVCDRGTSMDATALMLASLEAAERDSGAALLGRLDWIGVEDEISFPHEAPQEALARSLPTVPPLRVKTSEASGDGPIQLINDAANLIGKGVIRIAACVGAEAFRTAAQRAKEDIAAGREPPKNTLADLALARATPLARKFGLLTPIDVYPLYENAMRAAWGQSLSEAQAETALIWSRSSEVAAANPNAWLRRAVPPEHISGATADNRMVGFPYTKMMVANASVNMGAASIVTSLAAARELGIAESHIVYVGPGASAGEVEDFLRRDSFRRLPSLEATIDAALEFNALRPADIDLVELYSCFPCIPKAARRALNWPANRPTSVYGGLTFGGAPMGNCMMHAVSCMVQKLREGAGINGLIVANGGFATHSHSMVLTRNPVPPGKFPQIYDVQDSADALKGPVPNLLDSYEGIGSIETFAVHFGRDGPRGGVIVGRTPSGDRFVASVPKEDKVMLAFLMSEDREPVGSVGEVRLREGTPVWIGEAHHAGVGNE